MSLWLRPSLSWLAAGATLIAMQAGCSTDCDDALGKLGFCELPVPSALGGECDDESALACQARCLRDTSCEQLAQSMAGQPSDFERCAKTCGGEPLLSGLGGQGGQGAAGGAGGAEQ